MSVEDNENCLQVLMSSTATFKHACSQTDLCLHTPGEIQQQPCKYLKFTMCFLLLLLFRWFWCLVLF